ncbi:uncharacterized protein K452DRAFT_222702 [Aplosporella prunicola CBS 121167]|uniref:RTA1 like protein n=1 Tax=Aplosporella prunicola CBS 121167 TaxID=1176127 RepID=A0A6A6BNF6_9PEZI|nr:uncharacterized protein K452DRAFT_222702 [Aplosporella prunicola CBS 121167]KAF2144367.1 hypothetical protein K452DRAFT_222702 [Aplosporella prunicola CBS 121167]
MTDFDPETDCKLGTCPLELAQYTYVPSLAGNAVFAALFGLILLAQLGFGVRYKTWGFLVGMVGGVVLEIVGYVGRIQLHFNPFPFDPFLQQLICLTIGPAFLTAAIYVCLGRLIVAHSQAVSRLQPRTYTYIFVSFDILSLVLQAAGGAITATADDDQRDLADAGVNIMIAGLAAQVASLALFMALCAEYAFRLSRRRELLDSSFSGLRSTFKFKAFLFALAAATVLIFVRCCFRVAELNEGFNGELANDEVIFMILEGPMIILACACLTVFHPGISFGGRWAEIKAARQQKAVRKSVYASSSEMELEDARN